MPMMQYLDPRFRLVAVLIDDPDETLSMRETALRHAKLVAAECGFTFEEALAAAGITLAEKSAGGDFAAEPEEDETSDESEAADEHRGQIAAALQADPSRSDRDIARECGTSPTTVGKARAALGLDKAVRTVSRGGKSYDMAIGDRS